MSGRRCAAEAIDGVATEAVGGLEPRRCCFCWCFARRLLLGGGTEEPFEEEVMAPGVGKGETEDAPDAEISGVAPAPPRGSSIGWGSIVSCFCLCSCSTSGTSAGVIRAEEGEVEEEKCWRYAAATMEDVLGDRRTCAIALLGKRLLLLKKVVQGASLRLKSFESVRRITGVCEGERDNEHVSEDGLGRG